MIHAPVLLVNLLLLIDKLPQPHAPRGRGRPVVYSETLFLKALVIMTVRHLYKVGELLAVLSEEAMQPLRATLARASTAAFPPAAPGSGA